MANSYSEEPKVFNIGSDMVDGLRFQEEIWPLSEFERTHGTRRTLDHGDTKVFFNDKIVCVICGESIRKFDEELSALINKYRI